MVNLFIGLCKGVAGLPRDLRQLGYKHHAIEYKFLNGKLETVVPDLIVSSAIASHTLLLECKGGANTDADQLKRYSRVTSEDLRTSANVPPRCWLAHDVTLIGEDTHVERLNLGLTKSGCSFPLLAVEPTGIRLHAGKFVNHALTGVFVPKLSFRTELATTVFVPFDNESSQSHIAGWVLPEVVRAVVGGETQIDLLSLARRTVPTLDIMGSEHKRALTRKIKDVVQLAEQHEFHALLKRNLKAEKKTGTPTWDIVDSPMSLPPDKRQAAFRRLRQQQRRFIDALRTGRHSPVQPNLLDSLEA